jgi:ADP-ribose pyrophosphatase YjhB (NUDIX family)
MVASSILPVTIHKGKLYFLFGKENEMEDSAKGFSDFGGGVENQESITETAYREGAEEFCGFLGEPSQIKELIKKNGGTFDITFGKESRAYHIHIFFMEYDEKLPKYYKNHFHFVWNRMDKNILNSTKFYEKQEIRWFTTTDMKSHIKEFRPFYQEFIRGILSKESEIHKFILKKSKNRNSRTRKIRS